MDSGNRPFDDLARLAGGAASALGALREEIREAIRQQADRLLADWDLVTREEFEAVKAMAAKARAEQEALEKRLRDLEAALAKATKGPSEPRS
ncbi:MAG: accessory factor UbiK family protein [Alphaproteobacteria bacterium]|nr:accessory factor UbiK family protein [Alphaproteobacteria bacterium]